MLELKVLGVRPEGIDYRYGVPRTATYSLFQCPVCKSEFEQKRSKGLKAATCKDCRGTQFIKHGMSNTPVYKVWASMVQRCTNPKNKKYPIYGGKGITVNSKWETFDGFWEDMKDTFSDSLTIDRKDSSLGYNKENCRWVTLSQNSSETTKRRPVMQFRKVLVPFKSIVLERTWESALEAATSLGLVAAHITATCKENRQTHGGFVWKYV